MKFSFKLVNFSKCYARKQKWMFFFLNTVYKQTGLITYYIISSRLQLPLAEVIIQSSDDVGLMYIARS